MPASTHAQIVFATGPHDGHVSEVEVTWSFTSPSGQVLLSDPGGTIVGQVGDEGTASFSLDASASVRSFFVSGIDHIRFGLDHLLFLVVLTIAVVGAPVSGATTWRVAKLVTAFTVGHATSLVLAYFDVVSVPAALVEPAISLSIVIAAVLAIRGKGRGIRPWVAVAIGVIHGLGFASSLSRLGVAIAHQVPALVAFNIGIDVAQTVVVLLVTAGLWASARLSPERDGWIRVVVCGLAALVGLSWTTSQIVP